MTKSVKEVGWLDFSENTLEWKQFEADDQGNKNEQAGTFKRNLFPREQEQRQHSQQKNRQCVYIWDVRKSYSFSADSIHFESITRGLSLYQNPAPFPVPFASIAGGRIPAYLLLRRPRR